MLLFLLSELEAHPAVPQRDRLLAAGKALEAMVGTWQGTAWRMETQEIRLAFDHYNRFIALTHDADFAEELEAPKRHMTMHLLREMTLWGNPKAYANWRDEALNKTLKQCCRNVHQSTFDISVLSGMRQLLPKLCPSLV